MAAGDAKSGATLGFLTVLEHEQHGLFGGYLILNHLGRPLEFHCTAPVKANRAQQILYGPTLEPFLYGEQIGLTLLTKATHQPALVCTDVRPALAVREHVDLPIALVLAAEANQPQPTGETLWRIDAAHRTVANLTTFRHGRHELCLAPQRDLDRAAIAKPLELLGEAFDLLEPFGRIREAIDEAQRAGK